MDLAPYRGTVLLVPGFMGSKEDFLPVLSGLSRGGYRVLAMDGRGQHETGTASSAPSYAKSNSLATWWLSRGNSTRVPCTFWGTPTVG